MSNPAIEVALQSQLDGFKQQRAQANPEIFALRQDETQKLIATGIEKKVFISVKQRRISPFPMRMGEMSAYRAY